MAASHFGPFFFFSSPDGKSSLTGRLALSTHRLKLLECCAGFLGVGVAPGVRFTLLLNLSRILTHNLHLRPFMLGSFPQRHGCIFPPNQLTASTLLPVLDVCLLPFQLFFPNFNWKLSSQVSFGEDCGERGEPGKGETRFVQATSPSPSPGPRASSHERSLCILRLSALVFLPVSKQVPECSVWVQP